MQQFQGAVKKKIIPGFYMDMWNGILGKALTEKERVKKAKRPASHFMIDPIRSKYLDVLSENFIIHLLEESRTSKYGGKYFLYAIDYEICRENEVAKMKVKRCFECDEKLVEILHRDVPMTKGNYTEAEVKILGMIGSLNESEAMSALEISEAVGCSRQKVSNWCSKVLHKKNLIYIKKKDGRNYYYDIEIQNNDPKHEG